jgi:methylmalonyl-CoA mutase
MLKYHIQTSRAARCTPGDRLQRHPHDPAGAPTRPSTTAQSLHTNAYDEAITTPTEESVRRADGHSADHQQGARPGEEREPSQGAFIVEELTDLVEEAVLKEFDRI